MVAANAEYYISVTEILRFVTEQQQRKAALINHLNEQLAERKVVSVLFLSYDTAEELKAKRDLGNQTDRLFIDTIMQNNNCVQNQRITPNKRSNLQ